MFRGGFSSFRGPTRGPSCASYALLMCLSHGLSGNIIRSLKTRNTCLWEERRGAVVCEEREESLLYLLRVLNAPVLIVFNSNVFGRPSGSFSISSCTRS